MAGDIAQRLVPPPRNQTPATAVKKHAKVDIIDIKLPLPRPDPPEPPIPPQIPPPGPQPQQNLAEVDLQDRPVAPAPARCAPHKGSVRHLLKFQ